MLQVILKKKVIIAFFMRQAENTLQNANKLSFLVTSVASKT